MGRLSLHKTTVTYKIGAMLHTTFLNFGGGVCKRLAEPKARRTR